jgi:precorrin-2 dehydrogenase/sirohydrochlorin ferrochelatase
MRIPLYIEFRDKNILIIGGGSVGLRRAKRFLEAGAQVTVYSLSFMDGFMELGNVNLVKGDVKDIEKIRGLISNSDLVVVALPTKKYNELICKLAKDHHVLLNLANDSENTEVLVPLERSIDNIRITVTSEGRSVLLAREVMRMINECIDPREVRKVEDIMTGIRSYIMERYKDHRIRSRIYQILVEDEDFTNLISHHNYDLAFERAKHLIDNFRE